MSITTHTHTPTEAQQATTRRSGSLWRTTLVAGLVAAAIVTGAAAVAEVAGVSFEIDGESIPLLGFAQMTFLCTVIGGVMLAVLNRYSASAHRRFVQLTVALVVVSCIPSVLWPDETAAKLVLVGLHVLAAAIVVPAISRHARD